MMSDTVNLVRLSKIRISLPSYCRCKLQSRRRSRDDDDTNYEPQTNDDNGDIEIIIAERHTCNGPTGTVKLHFMKQYNKFTDIDYAHADMMG